MDETVWQGQNNFTVCRIANDFYNACQIVPNEFILRLSSMSFTGCQAGLQSRAILTRLRLRSHIFFSRLRLLLTCFMHGSAGAHQSFFSYFLHRYILHKVPYFLNTFFRLSAYFLGTYSLSVSSYFLQFKKHFLSLVRSRGKFTAPAPDGPKKAGSGSETQVQSSK